mgnify:CR=1 FL=1
MKLEPGMLAVSKAGRDKGHVYVIIDAGKEYVYVADGELRPLRHMKRKNTKHLQPVLRVRLDGTPDDTAVREIIRIFNQKNNSEKSS